MAADYDLFISYKSENANEVREIAEILMSSGLSVWFAEYSLPIDLYVANNLDGIQEAILGGIKNAEYALVFTNAIWAESEYCQIEIDAILERYPADRILQVCIPREDRVFERNPKLRDVATHVYQPGRVKETLEFIGGKIGKDLREPFDPRSVSDRQLHIRARGCAAQMDVAPLRLVNLPRATGFFGKVDSTDATLFIKFLPHRTTGTLVGHSHEELVKTAKRHESSPEALELTDDRLIYREYATRANLVCEKRGFACLGLHLFHSRGDDGLAGPTHMAVTIAEPIDRGFNRFRLARHYSIRLKDPVGGRLGEMVLLGGTVAVGSEPRRLQQAMSRLAPFFDAVARSVKYAGRKDERLARSWSLTNLLIFVTTLIVMPALLYFRALHYSELTRILAGAFFGLSFFFCLRWLVAKPKLEVK